MEAQAGDSIARSERNRVDGSFPNQLDPTSGCDTYLPEPRGCVRDKYDIHFRAGRGRLLLVKPSEGLRPRNKTPAVCALTQAPEGVRIW